MSLNYEVSLVVDAGGGLHLVAYDDCNIISYYAKLELAPHGRAAIDMIALSMGDLLEVGEEQEAEDWRERAEDEIVGSLELEGNYWRLNFILGRSSSADNYIAGSVG